jgi:hypothetical protein
MSRARALAILAGSALLLLALIYFVPVRAEASTAYPPKPQPCVTAPTLCAHTPTGPGADHFTPTPPVHHLALTGADFSFDIAMAIGMAVVGVALLVADAGKRRGK